MIFGLQQLVEGCLWLALPVHAQITPALTVAYLLFSNVLWPLYVPLAVWSIEPLARRRRMMLIPAAAGAVIGLFFLTAIVIGPVSSAIEGMHVKYHLPHPFHAAAVGLYALAACLPPLLSSHKWVRMFGVALIISMAAAYAAYSHWFASVWCFLAALLSILVLVHFLSESRRGGEGLRRG